MNWVVEDDLNMIMTEGSGRLLKYFVSWIVFKKTIKKTFTQKFGWKLSLFHIDKPIFYCSTNYAVLRWEQEGKRYITYYYTKMITAVMPM